MEQQIGGGIHMAGRKGTGVALKPESPAAEIIGELLQMVLQLFILDKIMAHSAFYRPFFSSRISPSPPFSASAFCSANASALCPLGSSWRLRYFCTSRLDMPPLPDCW